MNDQKAHKNSAKDLWIWGTGNTAEMFQEGFRRWNRFHQIRGYVNNDEKTWGGNFHGKPIISPNELMKQMNPYVLLCSNQLGYIDEIREQLVSMGVAWEFLERFVLDDLSEEADQTYQILEDEKSKQVYKYVSKCKKNGVYPAEESGLLDLDSGHGYFRMKEIDGDNSNEVFVDVGCFSGDTIEAYLNAKGDRFKQIHAFEADQRTYFEAVKNVKKLCDVRHIARDKIRIYPYGVGDRNEELAFRHSTETDGAGSKIVTDSTEGADGMTRIVTLDSFITGGSP